MRCTSSSPGFYSFLQNLARREGEEREDAPHLLPHFILFNPRGHWPGWRAIIAHNSGPPWPSCPLYLQPLPNLKGSCQYQGTPLSCHTHLAVALFNSSSPLPILQAVGSISPKRKRALILALSCPCPPNLSLFLATPAKNRQACSRIPLRPQRSPARLLSPLCKG